MLRNTLIRKVSRAVRPAQLPFTAPLSNVARNYTYFDNLEIKDGVAIVRLNGPGKMNTISTGLQSEAEKIFNEEILVNKDVKAVVFISSKPDSFIAGADIGMISTIKDKSELVDLCMNGHLFFKEAKKSGMPFVAAINGVALGGGLEWAMYCDYRICTTHKKTALGLPEVKLGLMPGMAGTYHLPKLVGLQEAAQMILTGKIVKPEKAKKLGLIDLVVDPACLESVAIEQAKGLVAGTVKSTKRKMSYFEYFATQTTPGREFLFYMMKQTVDKSAGGHYPAPYEIMGVLKDNFQKSELTYLTDEARRFAKLAATPQSEALIGIFQGSNSVKKHTFGKPSHPIKTIAVLGAGLMGAGIATVSVLNGNYRVLLKDKDEAGVSRGQKIIDDTVKLSLTKKKITNFEYTEVTSRLTPLHDDVESWKKHFGQADMVIEAVFEEIGVKHRVLKEMEEVIPDHCIFASNTSAIPISKIAEGAKRPERVIGMHYFSPVPLMPLLEIITHSGTAPEVAAGAMEVGARQGKTTILVKDVPGFFVNRCLAPFMVEVTALVQEGVDLPSIDKAMKVFGMPVGPITLSDEVGIDISNHVGAFMSKADLGDRMLGGNAAFMRTMVERGMLGRKTGKGFYLYPKEAKKSSKEKQINPEVLAMLKEMLGDVKNPKMTAQEIQQRLVYRFINEAAFCLQDGIIRAPADGDIGAVFGIGFPPFLGGPFRLLDVMGTRSVVDQMLQFRDLKGPQFEPAQILKDYAAADKKFHL